MSVPSGFLKIQKQLVKDVPVLWLSVALLLLLFISRLVGIGAFPAFVDESVHVHFVQDSFQISPLMYASEGKLFAIWWYMLFQPHLAASLWVIRVATLLAALPGVAACMAIGRQMAGRWGLVLAGLFYLFSTYLMFFDRLGLADPIAASAIAVALFLGYRVSRTAGSRDAVLLGIVLFIGINTKMSTVPYAVLPLIAGLTLRAKGQSWLHAWRANVRWTGIALATEGILIGGLALAMRLRHYDIFSLIGVHNTGESPFDLSSKLSHVVSTVNLFMAYMGPIAFVLLIAAVLVLIVQRRLYLVAALGLPLIVIWLNRTQYSRFFILTGIIFVLCGAVVLADLVRRQGKIVQWLGIGAVLIYGLVQWVPFAWTAINDPVALAVSPADRQEYISSDASGFGLAEVHSALQNAGAHEVIGLLSNCFGLQFLIHGEMNLTCPILNPNGSSIDQVNQLVAGNRRAGVYVVLEDTPFVPNTIAGQVLTIIQRPNNGPRLSVISLAP
jgi:hypothetical protein